MGLRRSKRLALELAGDRSASLGERHVSRHVIRNLSEAAFDKTTCGDRDGLRVARLCVRLSSLLHGLRRWVHRPDESAEMARSFAELAAALRLANRLDHAERALELAFDLAPAHLKGDLHRRRAWLRMYQLRVPEAVGDATTAEKLTIGQEHALALGTLGVAFLYSGRYEAAIEQLDLCMSEMAPDNEARYCGMLGCYILALSKGSERDAQRGLKLCAKLRKRLKASHKMQRAKLWWIEGLLKERLGDPDGSWWALDIARRSLVAMKAAPEVAAIVADMARVSPRPLAIRHLCTEAAEVIESPHPLSEPLRKLARAAADLIPEAAAALRRAANLITPCPSL